VERAAAATEAGSEAEVRKSATDVIGSSFVAVASRFEEALDSD
jgi:hypothetical protein